MLLDGHPDYPDENEVAATMQSSSYWPKDPVKQKFALRQALLGAQKAARSWEHITGWSPFLSSGEPETRLFRRDEISHNGDLDFKNGLIRLDSVSMGGVVQTRDFAPCLYPLNARYGRIKKPHTSLRGAFGRGYGGGYGLSSGYGYGAASLIEITGVWGYSLTVPEDVYQGLLQVGAAVVLQQTENLQSIGSISEDGFSKSFDITGVLTQTALANLWGKDFNTTAQQFFRVTGAS